MDSLCSSTTDMKHMNLRNAALWFRAALCACALAGACSAASNEARHVFLFIGDGMGLSQVQLAESLLGARAGNRFVPLRMTSLPTLGLARTYSGSDFVTDSAAGGTALATGHKTANGMLGVNCSNTCRFVSIAERAHQHSRKVGMVTTDTLIGATPAAFFAHQPSRDMDYPIGADMLASGFDLFFATGGFGDQEGKNVPTNQIAYLTNVLAPFVESIVTGTSGPVVTWKPLLGLTSAYGYTMIESAHTFVALHHAPGKIIAVGNVPQAIVAASNAVTLADVTRTSIELLDGTNGFFLMVEGARIDKACHPNDAATAVKEVIALDQAIDVAYAFYTNHPDDTLIVVTADHETGGITLGHDGCKFALLDRQTVTAAGFWEKLDAYRAAHTTRNMVSRMCASAFFLKDAGKPRAAFNDIRPLLRESFGLGDDARGLGLSPQEWRQLEQAFDDSMLGNKLDRSDDLVQRKYSGQDPLTITAQRMLYEKAGVKFATFNHSGAAVMIGAIGVGQEAFVGFHDNTDIPKAIMQVMLPTGE